MSRESVLSMIDRVERIADMLPECSEREINSLGGQVIGTLQAIVSELKRNGIPTSNEIISEMGDEFARTQNVNDAVFALHTAAGYLRGLAQKLS